MKTTGRELHDTLLVDDRRHVSAAGRERTVHSLARTIRWLVFALSICGGVNVLLPFFWHFGTVASIKAREGAAVAKVCSTHNDTRKPGSACDRHRKADELAKKLDAETMVASLPLVGLRLTAPDFLLVTNALGVFLLFWLSEVLAFTRLTLCSLHNSRVRTSPDILEGIPATFILLWPGGARRGTHRVVALVLWGFLASFVIILGSDVYDICLHHRVSTEGSLWNHPGWDAFKPFIFARYIALGLFALASFLFILRVGTALRDTRNLLLLLEWAPRAFWPTVERTLERAGVRLAEGRSELLYDYEERVHRRCPRWFGHYRLALTLRLQNKHYDASGQCKGQLEQNGVDIIEIVSKSSVDLWRAVRDFRVGATRPWLSRDDPEEGAYVSSDEARMREFFFAFVFDENEEKRTEIAGHLANALTRRLNLGSFVQHFGQVQHVSPAAYKGSCTDLR